MSSSFVEGKNTITDSWHRITHELLQEADIEINGKRPFDIRIKKYGFL